MGSREVAEEVAWGEPARREPRWPAAIAVVLAIILYATLPSKLSFGPMKWLIPGLEVVLLLPLLATNPYRHNRESMWERTASIAIIALITLANLISLLLLVHLLLAGRHEAGRSLIFYAIEIWFTNVLVFGLWFWELDRGGPGERTSIHHRQPDFLFPQMATPGVAPTDWTPSFVDYLYVSFTNAAAFSPTDTMPLTEWAKLLMLVQSLASLLTIALVAARAVNILN
jgi:uncharacterized membrane protein